MDLIQKSILSAVVVGTVMFASAEPADAQVYFNAGFGGYYSPGYYSYPYYGYYSAPIYYGLPYYAGYGNYAGLIGSEYPWDVYDYARYDYGRGFDYGGTGLLGSGYPWDVYDYARYDYGRGLDYGETGLGYGWYAPGYIGSYGWNTGYGGGYGYR